MQSSSEVPSAAELVSAIEKLVKTKMVSLFAGLSVHSCGPENSPFVLVPLPAWKTSHFLCCQSEILDLKIQNNNLQVTSVIFLSCWISVFMLVFSYPEIFTNSKTKK